MGMIKFFIGFAALTLATTPVMASEPTQLKIAQAVVNLPNLTFYLNVLDEMGKPMEHLDQQNFQLNLDGKPLALNSLKPFKDASEGVAYFFIVDVSLSMSKSDFEEIRQGLHLWIDQMKDKDRAALFTVGDGIELVAPYQAGLAELKSQVDLLVPQARQTRLHEGLVRAIELNRAAGSDLPLRRVIVLLSDGRDEGSALTATDVEGYLEKEGVPIYAIGFSRLKDKRQDYLNLLRRFAFKSGGLFYLAEENTLTDAYAKVAQATAQVWRLETKCSDCQSDGQYHHLSLFLNAIDGHRELLFPPTPTPPPPTTPPPTPWYQVPLYLGLLIASSLILLALIFMLLRRKQTAEEVVVLPDFDEPEDMTVASGLSETPIEAESEGPESGVRFELVLVKGQGFTRNTWAINGPLIIGRSPNCDITIPGERVSSRHCRLSLAGSHIMITDADSMNGTLINGIPLQNSKKLNHGDLLLIGDSEYRFLIPEAL